MSKFTNILNQAILESLRLAYAEHMSEISVKNDSEVSNSDACYFIDGFEDNSVALIGTDEPYGVPPTRLNMKARSDITTDFKWDGELPAHLTIPWVYHAARVLIDGGALWNCGFPDWSTTFRAVCEDAGLTWRVHKAWFKTNCAPHFRNNNFVSAYELVWIASKGDWRPHFKFQEQRVMQNWVAETTCTVCGCVYPVYLSNNFDHPEWFSNAEFDHVDPVELPKFTGKPWMDSLCPSCNNTHPVYLQSQAIFDQAFSRQFISPLTNDSGRKHPTKKPKWMAQELLSILGSDEGVFIDPFCGQGTFPIAAKEFGMRSYANDFAGDGEERWYHHTKAAMKTAQRSIMEVKDERVSSLQEAVWNVQED